MPGKSILPRWVLLVDVLAGLLSITLAYTLVNSYPSLAVHSRVDLSFLDVIFYVGLVVMTLTGIALGGDYVRGKRYSRLADIILVSRSVIVAFALLVSSAFILEDFILSERYDFSRPGIIILISSLTCLLLLVRLAAHYTQTKSFDSGNWRKKMVIVGAGVEGLEVYEHLQAKNWLGVNCVGFIDEAADASPVPDVPLLGRVDDLPVVVKEQGVEEIVIALAPEEHDTMTRIVNNGVRRDVKVRIIPDSFAYPYSEIDIQEYDGLAMIDVKQQHLNSMHGGFKRFMDIAISSFLLLVHAIPMLFIAGIIKLTSRGPALYRQTRLSKEGKSFEMLKFRSMVEGAHEQRVRLADKNEAVGPIFKIREDPRVTRFGSFLRRTSLDELPQLINVLKGDMSIVGPRPPLPDEVGRYRAHHLKRLAVRPGVTGLWQVSGRDRRDFEDMAKLDLYYIENWSIRLDIKIILKTVPTVLSRKGAY